MLGALRISGMLLLVAVTLAGCGGSNGPRTPQPGAVATEPQAKAGEPPAHKQFVLDGLIQ